MKSTRQSVIAARAAGILRILLVLLLSIGLLMTTACGRGGDAGEPADSGQSAQAEQEAEPESDAEAQSEQEAQAEREAEPEPAIDEDGEYTTHEDVALYIHTYHRLPSNYMTKKEAQERGWKSNPKKHGIMIGGDHFGNYEGLLPEDLEYRECDVDYKGKGRGASRLIYTQDGAVWYTKDHYESFEQLYEGD